MQGDGGFDHAQVGAAVAAVQAQLFDEQGTDFHGQFFLLLQTEAFHVVRRLDVLDIFHSYWDWYFCQVAYHRQPTPPRS